MNCRESDRRTLLPSPRRCRAVLSEVLNTRESRVRTRIPTGMAVAGTLALAVLTTCSYYVFTPHRRMLIPTRPAAFHIDSADAQRCADPEVLLAAADHFYFLNNGPAAPPLSAPPTNRSS